VTDRGLLAELARLGPFFALDSHPAGAPLGAGWRRLDELIGQPAALAARVAEVRASLARAAGRPPGEVELRVAASMTQLGLTGRLICPPLGVAVLTGRLLELEPALLRWRPDPAGGAVALTIRADALPQPGSAAVEPGQLAAALASTLLAGPVRALVQASRPLGVSPKVLWGNVASVVNGAKALIAVAEPGLTAAADALVSALLSQPPLQGAHGGGPEQPAAGQPAAGQPAAGQPAAGRPASPFRRRSCCLVYRLAPTQGPVCGDCVLDRGPVPANRDGESAHSGSSAHAGFESG